MTDTVVVIPLANLALAFVPVVTVLLLMLNWGMKIRDSLYGMARMLIQLLLIGYALGLIFTAEHGWIVMIVLSVMVGVASWIALRSVSLSKRQLYPKVLLSILLGGGFTLMLMTQGVLDVEPWYAPRQIIPLAGMIFASSMNSVSLAIERVITEMAKDINYDEARRIALKTALIPITNMLFAVGLVSLPGMMTGQILSGVSAMIAARYQIMVMCMMFASAGLSAGCVLVLIKPYIDTKTSL